VQALFDETMRREPRERRSFIDQATAGDPELGREVSSLLDAHERAGDLLEAPALQSAAHLFVDEAAHAPETPQTVGPYIIRHELGRGGMGVVYLADDTRLSRRVALKAIPRSVSGDPVRRERLRQEARATAALSHPGIATVFALEEFDGELYIASEYVAGQTLKALAASAPVSMEMVGDIARQMARALAAAHAQGIVHRDLKPENVMRTSGGVIKILDFGIARFDGPVLSGLTGLTAHGAVVGTMGYMAPEQVRGEQVDVRADLFSFGVLIYELATRSNPMDGGNLGATVARTLELDPPLLSGVRDGCPLLLARIVATCLR
jgi:serine/threonine protein kinase